MASKKGIIVTVIILTVITAASFSLWIIPQNNQTTFVVSNYGNYLDGVKNIHEVLQESIFIEYQNLLDGSISPNEYIVQSEITTTQVTSEISKLIVSKPPEQWQQSYISYLEAMRAFNQYVKETKVIANLIETGNMEKEITQITQKLELLELEIQKHIQNSDQLRPN